MIRRPPAPPTLGQCLVQAAPLLPVLAVFALWTGSLVAPALVAGVLLGALVRAVPWAAPPALERLAVGGVLAAGVAASPLLLADASAVHGRLGLLQASAALAALLCAAFRRWFAAPRGRRLMDAALEATALIACGMGRIGPAYGALALAWLGAALLALRTQDPRAGPPVERARPAATAAVAALALGTAATLALALPPAARLAERALGAWWLRGQARSGFSGTLRLGAMEGLLQSDRVVLRLWGPPVDYLRGGVFDSYVAGYWGGPAPRGDVRTALGPGRSAVEVRYAGEPRRYFLPLGARAVATPTGRARAEPGGILAPLGADAPEVYWFSPGPEQGAAGVEPPGPADLAVPGAVAERLRPLVERWTAGRPEPRARVQALAAALQAGFAYDTRFRRDARLDPVVDFLTVQRRGHCEYFASALALLARTAGVPARLVTGYRAVERNGFGGYAVVRERDAHAWVEAWLPGEGWRTFDATPAGGVAREQPAAAALADAAFTGARRALAALQDLSLGQTFALLGGAVALLATVRAWNVRRGRRAGRRPARSEGPPPWFGRLAAALAGAGLGRAPAEPVERWARRLAAAGQAPAADLVRRYAALRYGGEGDAAALAAEMEACAAGLRVRRAAETPPAPAAS